MPLALSEAVADWVAAGLRWAATPAHSREPAPGQPAPERTIRPRPAPPPARAGHQTGQDPARPPPEQAAGSFSLIRTDPPIPADGEASGALGQSTAAHTQVPGTSAAATTNPRNLAGQPPGGWRGQTPAFELLPRARSTSSTRWRTKPGPGGTARHGSRKGIEASRAATDAALDAWEPSDEPTRDRLHGLRALLTFWRAVGHLDIPVDYEVPIGGIPASLFTWRWNALQKKQAHRWLLAALEQLGDVRAPEVVASLKAERKAREAAMGPLGAGPATPPGRCGRRWTRCGRRGGGWTTPSH